jgi:hypothetical protein
MVVTELTEVPPFAIGNMPVTPEDRGSPVAFVSVRTEGVSKLGVDNMGELLPTKLPVPVCPESPVFTALFVAIINLY